MPSIVVTCWPCTAEIGVTHERVAWPSMCTVQAPHCAMPHPNFVPCKPTTSRIAHKSGMSGSASRVTGLPLSVKATDMMKDPLIGLDHLCREIVVLVEAQAGRRARHNSTRAGLSMDVGLGSANRKSF